MRCSAGSDCYGNHVFPISVPYSLMSAIRQLKSIIENLTPAWFSSHATVCRRRSTPRCRRTWDRGDRQSPWTRSPRLSPHWCRPADRGGRRRARWVGPHYREILFTRLDRRQGRIHTPDAVPNQAICAQPWLRRHERRAGRLPPWNHTFGGNTISGWCSTWARSYIDEAAAAGASEATVRTLRDIVQPRLNGA